MKPAHYSDDKLIKLFNEGDSLAFAQVYDLCFPNLCYFAYSITRDMAEAEDITVTSLQILFSRSVHFDNMESLKSYLYTTAKNQCLKYLKRIEKQNESHKELYSLQGDSDNDYLSSQEVYSELIEMITHEIESLSPKRKEVFKLYYLEGLDIREIAEKLNMTPSTVSDAKYKALEYLRKVAKRLSPVAGILFLLQ